jgi:phosphohistidine phosphatase
MILIIMRHGEAVSYKEPDHARSLTEFGQQQCENVGKWLHQNISTFLDDKTNQGVDGIDLALVSPYLRTQQSFQALAKHVKVEQEITTDTVTPEGNVVQGADLIHGYANEENASKCMLVVTHMPLVSLLAAHVCVGVDDIFFEPADALIVNYSKDTGFGTKLALCKG